MMSTDRGQGERSPTAVAVLVATACIFYGGVSAIGIAQAWRHHELIGFLLQAVVLLPVLWWAWTRTGLAAPTDALVVTELPAVRSCCLSSSRRVSAGM